MKNPNKETAASAADSSEQRPDVPAELKIHPAMTALEYANEPAVVIDGFLGTSKADVVRLYQVLDTSAYIEISEGAILHMEAARSDPGAVRAFVRASSPILTVWRERMRAGHYRPDSRRPVLPPVFEPDPDGSPARKIHPAIAALESSNEPAVVLEGFLGTGEDAVVRLYHSLDTSAYLELPKVAIIHMDADGHNQGYVRVLVRASGDILSVRRERVSAGNYAAGPRPPIVPRPNTCHGFCEEEFKALVLPYFQLLTRALREQNPARAEVLFAQAGILKERAKSRLYDCLSQCLQRFPGSFPFGIGPIYSRIVAQNLEAQE